MKSTAAAIAMCVALGLGAASAETTPSQPEANRDKVPITTASNEARALFLQARDMAEKLRITDAQRLYEAAVAKDPGFAQAYLGLATTAPTTGAFFAALDHAVALVGKVSAPERLLIEGFSAGVKGKPVEQQAAYTKLAATYPKDERVINLVANLYFGRQDYNKAIETYTKVVAINPAFSQPYNQLGYAYRFVEDYPKAEATFKKYIELIPNDPNPYDSYAELLMKIGRFDESIKSYEKALAMDGNFISAYVGIANDQMFSGRPDEARKTLAKLAKVARNDGELRQAMAWTAEAYIHEAAWDSALAEIDRMIALADQAKDPGQQANDLNFKANTLLEANRLDEAAAAFKAQVEANDRSSAPADVKATVRRNALYDEARVALARHDLATAKARAAAYARAVAAKQVPFELRQHHELAGMVALADAKPRVAAGELAQANQQDPRVLYLLAMAHAGAGDAGKAQAMAKKAVDFNGLSLNYGYVRGKAKGLLKS